MIYCPTCGGTHDIATGGCPEPILNREWFEREHKVLLDLLRRTLVYLPENALQHDIERVLLDYEVKP